MAALVSLAELTSAAMSATEPALVSPSKISVGGVDPLGLREINFDLMDLVLPGLNNVARHIRPFVVTTWAWRRAFQLAKSNNVREIKIDRLQDFVDRIEVIYSWSQFLRDPNADLPGRQVLSALVQGQNYKFGGPAWQKRRDVRRDSTAFSAAVNYGPALKSLGWLAQHDQDPGVLVPSEASTPALDAFEEKIQPRLTHPAFSNFGSVTVTATEAEQWAGGWALEKPTPAEKRFMAEVLLGARAPEVRRKGGALMLAVVATTRNAEPNDVRKAMAGRPGRFRPPAELQGVADAWRRLQVRQLFRLSLEALFFWVVGRVAYGASASRDLVAGFLADDGTGGVATATEWLDRPGAVRAGPIALMDRIRGALQADDAAGLATAIADGLALSIAEAPLQALPFERVDRLPLFRARREALAWGTAGPDAFLKHVLESWIFAQHVYWAVGRGLADARSHGKTLLRLKVVLEEDGWTLAPGASAGKGPVPTPDRLQTALSLAGECGLL